MLLRADRATLQQMLSLQKDLMSRLTSTGLKDTQGQTSAANPDFYRHICAELVFALLGHSFSIQCHVGLNADGILDLYEFITVAQSARYEIRQTERKSSQGLSTYVMPNLKFRKRNQLV